MENKDEEQIEDFYTEVDSTVVITELLNNEYEEDMKSTSSGSIEYLVDEPIVSYRNVKSALDSIDSTNGNNQANLDTFEYIYTNSEYYNEEYVKNPLVRSITLSKWPKVGFGFKLNRSIEKKYFYINEILPDSPAESCLNIGDLIIELEEFDNPYIEFNNLNEIERYLNEKENLHLIALENSNYLKFNLENKSLKHYARNCEDIVIVSWNQLKQEAD